LRILFAQSGFFQACSRITFWDIILAENVTENRLHAAHDLLFLKLLGDNSM